MELVLGQKYTRKEIHKLVGGHMVDYLPSLNGQIVCGCFDNNLNKRAPYEIDVCYGPRVIKNARDLTSQGNTVPVFLKRTANVWEYVGRFRSTGFSEKPEEWNSATARRECTVGELYLERVFEEGPTSAAMELIAQEGSLTLQTHFVRERDPSLAEAKRNEMIGREGNLRCQSCGLEANALPEGLGYKCFEVHHLEPLGVRDRKTPTRLSDLAVVCANCHKMIHAEFPCLTLAALRAKLVLTDTKKPDE